MSELEVINIIEILRQQYLVCISKNQHSYAQNIHNEIDRWEEHLHKLSNKRQAEMFEDDKYETEVVLDPATEKQAQFLASRGYDAYVLSQLSKQRASQLIGEIKDSESNSPAVINTSVKSALADEFRKLCKFELCGKKATVKGMCNKHYQIEHKKKLKGGE